MKILIVHEVNYLAKIVYEYQILPEMLSMMGHEVTVVDYDDTWKRDGEHHAFDLRTSVYPGVHRAYAAARIDVRRPGMIRFPIVSRISAAVTTALEVASLLRVKSADVVLLYGLPTVGVQTLWAARLYHVPIFFRSIDILNQMVPSSMLIAPTKWLERYVYNRVDGILTVTEHLKKYVQSFGVPETRVQVLPSGVDAEMFAPGPRNERLLAKWQIGAADPVILFMGTIYRFSGLDRVIRDFPSLLQRHPEARLLIVGVGEDEDRLKQIVSEVGVSKNVIFTGLQPYSLLPDIIRSSTVCINPFELNSITRGILPTKLFQYLACGKPVLATELPGTVPFLTGEQDGIVYAPLDRFVATLSELLNDGAKRDELGRRGESVARQHYDWKRTAEKLVQYILERT